MISGKVKDTGTIKKFKHKKISFLKNIFLRN